MRRVQERAKNAMVETGGGTGRMAKHYTASLFKVAPEANWGYVGKVQQRVRIPETEARKPTGAQADGTAKTDVGGVSLRTKEAHRKAKADGGIVGDEEVQQRVQRYEETGTEKIASPTELWELFHAQRQRCALTGEKLTASNSSIDHIVPLCDGGTNLIGNLQWVTTQVNQMKNTMGQAEFIKVCGMVYERAAGTKMS